MILILESFKCITVNKNELLKSLLASCFFFWLKKKGKEGMRHVQQQAWPQSSQNCSLQQKSNECNLTRTHA